MKSKIVLLVVYLSIYGFAAQAQSESDEILPTQNHPYSGINVLSKDSTYDVNFRFTLQNRFEAESDDVNQPYKWDRHAFYTKRLLLRSDGFLVDKSIQYFFQVGFSQDDQGYSTLFLPNSIQDAIVFYQPTNQFKIGFGLTTLPGNRQKMVSSGSQQFVVRSILNSMLGVDRDQGLFFRFTDNKARLPYRLHLALTNGTGRTFAVKTEGFAITGKAEILPFGEFANKGDYFEGDFAHQETPKLSLALAYSANIDANRTGGQTGVFSNEKADIYTFFADAHFKYRGFAAMGEFALRDISNPVSNNPPNSIQVRNKGYASNLQFSYQTLKHHEVAFRWARFSPDKEIEQYQDEINDITLAYSKYLRFHRVKIQGDITYRKEEYGSILQNEVLIYRFQVQVGI